MKRSLDPHMTQSTMKSQMEFEEKSDFSLPSLLLENFQSKISMLDQLLYTSLWPGVSFHFSEEDFMTTDKSSTTMTHKIWSLCSIIQTCSTGPLLELFHLFTSEKTLTWTGELGKLLFTIKCTELCIDTEQEDQDTYLGTVQWVSQQCHLFTISEAEFIMEHGNTTQIQLQDCIKHSI